MSIFGKMKSVGAVLLACLALAACLPQTPQIEPLSFRDQSRIIASTTRGGGAQLQGVWHVVATYPNSPPLGSEIVISGNLWRLGGQVLQMEEGFSGRFTRDSGAPFWLIWVDEGLRTAVIGTPDGSIGWIMDRNPPISGDRLRAAREIFEFNGYDTERLTAG